MRAHHHGDFEENALAAKKGETTVTACVPAKDCAGTIAAVVNVLTASPLVDEVVVVSADAPTGAAAAAAGARVLDEAALVPHAGPVRGKGDAMWRAVPELPGDVVLFLDGDSPSVGAHFVSGLLGPLLTDEADFAKAFYRRPMGDDPAGGGRVNHLVARPTLGMLLPALAEVRQPLAGEVAVRRSLLERIPFATGYGVETAMLVDVHRVVGIERMVQVDLGEMVNAHQPLQDLVPMAETVLRIVAARAGVPGIAGPEERAPWR